ALRNTGTRRGKAVVQIYVSPPRGQDRPAKELRGFQAITLDPEEEALAEVSLDMRAFAYFDVDRNAWHAPAGDYVIRVGTSSAELPNSVTVTLESSWIEPCTTPPLDQYQPETIA
ncbi:MAG: fibronectin type III-like domain-contianing protein, partial [Maritimibacter sp.]